MYIIDDRLKQKEEDNPIKIGVIDAGEIGKGFLKQIYNYTTGMKIVAVYNRRAEKAKASSENAKVRKYKTTATYDEFEITLENETTAIKNQVEFKGGDSAVLVRRIASNARRSAKEADGRTGLLCHL
jgi:predicted homoserine dehydrogenase-like protein